MFVVRYARPALSGSARNLARGILIPYRWSRGACERRSSPQSRVQRTRIGRRSGSSAAGASSVGKFRTSGQQL